MGLELMVGETDSILTNRSKNSSKQTSIKFTIDIKNNKKIDEWNTTLADSIANKYTKNLKDYNKDSIISN